jgi:hypothetical protein
MPQNVSPCFIGWMNNLLQKTHLILVRNALSLRACLVGYSEAVGYLSNSTQVQTWSGEESYQHQAWVEQDARAVFLEDLLLEEPGWTWQGTEIADCQGK